MRNILIIAPYISLPGEAGFNRFYYIAENLSRLDFNVTLISSKFRHFDKKFRSENLVRINENLKVVLLEEKGYKKNIDINRLISHKQWDENLKSYFNDSKQKLDLIYCAIPTPSGACIAGEYAERNRIPFVIDVQDIWPEAMRMAIDVPVLSDIMFYPMKRQVNRAYSMADAILGVSETYVERAAENNNKTTIKKAVFIGTDIDVFDTGAEKYAGEIEKPSDEFWVVYAGTLGHSYDIKTMIEASCLLKKKGMHKIKFKILGGGPLRQQLEQQADRIGAPAEFLGYLSYGEMAAYLRKSDLSVNSLQKKATQSIINKVGDYLSAGIPIMNGSLNKELQGILREYGAGISYAPEDAESLADGIEMLYRDDQLRLDTGKNARTLAEEKFDRGKIYQDIYDVVQSLTS
jgi:glycosyltransferase involved in cell wall biosynthesis